MLIGIVGCPNSGKSTMFKALTLADAEIADYPFTTIKPNEGIGYVTTPCACRRLNVKCNPKNSQCIGGIRHIPVKILDVAGLVPGAHEGKGLGNQFLDDLRQASGLIHVLDVSGRTNPEGKPDHWDPEKTIDILEDEIDEWIAGIIKRSFKKIETLSRTQRKPMEKLLAQQLSGLGICEEHIKRVINSGITLSEENIKTFATELRKVSKPIIIAANKIDLPEAEKNLEKLRKHGEVVPCCAEAELALKEAARHDLIKYIPGDSKFEIISDELNEKQKRALEFIKNILERFGSTGVQQCLNKLVFDMLSYIVVYPVANIGKLSDNQGNILPDAYLVPKGTTLKELASMIHTDIAESFIGGLDLNRKKLGADYELKDGDVIEILFKK